LWARKCLTWKCLFLLIKRFVFIKNLQNSTLTKNKLKNTPTFDDWWIGYLKNVLVKAPTAVLNLKNKTKLVLIIVLKIVDEYKQDFYLQSGKYMSMVIIRPSGLLWLCYTLLIFRARFVKICSWILDIYNILNFCHQMWKKF
jgi:hypothetical protein